MGISFFIQAGLPQPKAKIHELGRVYSLPYPFMDRRNFMEPVRGAGANTQQRSQACLDIITRERPDLFMTEFFPLGREECRHELIPSLLKAYGQGAVLWALAGYPLLTGADSEWRQNILKLYRQIFVFSPSSEKDFIAGFIPWGQDRQRYLSFFERNSQKIKFAGYLLPRQELVDDERGANLPKPSVSKESFRIAVLRGGGAYFPKIIAQSIRASDLLGKEYFMTVVAGPSTTLREWNFFVTLAGKKKINNLVLLKAVSDYEGLIKRSDICVSVASYHTSVMLLKYRRKAVLIPFEGYGSMSIHEQPARAAMLKEMMGAKILSIRDLTAQRLTTALRDTAALKEVNSRIPKEWFEGRDFLDRQLTGLFRQPPH